MITDYSHSTWKVRRQLKVAASHSFLSTWKVRRQLEVAASHSFLRHPVRHIAGMLALLLLLAGCQPTRRLAEGEQLYRGSEVVLAPTAPSEAQKLTGQLESFSQPAPNQRFLGLPVRLGIYNTFDPDNDGKGIGHWIKTRIGEAPVRYREQDRRRSALRMERFLMDRGFLQANVSSDTSLRKKMVRIHYRVKPGPLYRLQHYDFPPDTGRFAHLTREIQKAPPLRPGDPVALKRLDQERTELARRAQAAGYYLVKEDNFFYYLDTLAGDHRSDLYLRLRPPQDSGQYARYRIGQTFVYPSYEPEAAAGDTLHLAGLHLIRYDTFLRPSVLQRLIRQDAGEWFAPDQQNRTLSQLSGLGIYKFVNLKYQGREAGDSSFLDRLIYLTPSLPQFFSAELEMTNEPGFIGSKVNLAYTHRNLFRGAEQLRLKLAGGLLTQIGSNDGQFLRALEISGEASLEVPRIIFPFLHLDPGSISPPRTIFRLNGQYLFDFQNFTLNSILLQAGYRWQPSGLVQHELYPVNISQQMLLRSTDAFRNRLVQNARLRESVEDIFILGIRYRFLYAEPEQTRDRSRYFFLGTVETSGNLADLLTTAGTGRQKLFGRSFSRYLRLEADGRHYFRIGKSNLVSRLNVGVGYAYGDSQVMPFSKQFSTGGSNSIRAFRIRQLGPGRSDEFLDSENIYSEQTGDLKLEANLEYRFPLISYLRGALFLDAGNIWLLRDPGDENPGGVFRLDSFYEEYALGAGLGLRLDIDLFVIRLDAAFPVRRPWLLPASPWLQDFQPLRKAWRKDNLTWHLALGYPF